MKHIKINILYMYISYYVRDILKFLCDKFIDKMV